jgi:uncharacterized protein (DUF427 family)
MERVMWDYKGQKRPAFAVEPNEGQESVWDYPRPPAVEPCDRLVEVRHKGELIARSEQCYRILETASPPTFYVPDSDINGSLLTEIAHDTFCEWKGNASYLALADDPGQAPVAWYYKKPFPAFAMLMGYTAFYPGRVDCFVDGEAVRPQRSEFYGGWVTSDVVGPFKGDPGTGHW